MGNKDLEEQGRETRARIFEYIFEYILRKGYPPTFREIQKGVGLRRTSTVYHHIERLEKEGKIDRDPETARAFRITDSAWREYLVEYRCLYPFGCKETSDRPGSCPLHGTELVAFINKK